MDAAATSGGEAIARRSPAGTAGPVMWLCGPTGVGKSTAGFDLFQRHVLSAGIAGAFVDLDQIGFYQAASPVNLTDHQMRARILAGMWRGFRAAGAACLVVVGPAESPAAITTYARALPAATFTICRLHAPAKELTRRIMLRGRGGNWAQPGDPLRGRTAAYLAAVADRAAADARILDREAVGDLRIDTARRTAEQTADAIIDRTGWPAGPRPH